MSDTTIDYLRHGEPEGGSIYRGNSIDDPLSEHGWQQMRDTIANIQGWTQIISSPMQRCHAFAEWLAEERNLPMEVIDDLKEVGFGSWEGSTPQHLKNTRIAEYDAFYLDPVNNRPTGAEPLDVFGARVADAYEKITQQYKGQHILVIAHAGVIRATLGHVTQAPAGSWYKAAINNAAISRFSQNDFGNTLVHHNWLPSL